MRKALIEMDGWLRAQSGRSTHGRVFVDSAPVLERSWGMQAGMGFIGKNTCLINPDIGSWFFIGGLLVPEALEYDDPPVEIKRQKRNKAKGKNQQSPVTSPNPRIPQVNSTMQFSICRSSDGRIGTCGRCTRCLDICPTCALVSPHELDARLCISYLTIELRGRDAGRVKTKGGKLGVRL